MHGQYQYRRIQIHTSEYISVIHYPSDCLYNIFRLSPQQAGIGMTAALNAIGATPSESEPQNAKYASFYHMFWDSMTFSAGFDFAC